MLVTEIAYSHKTQSTSRAGSLFMSFALPRLRCQALRINQTDIQRHFFRMPFCLLKLFDNSNSSSCWLLASRFGQPCVSAANAVVTLLVCFYVLSWPAVKGFRRAATPNGLIRYFESWYTIRRHHSLVTVRLQTGQNLSIGAHSFYLERK